MPRTWAGLGGIDVAIELRYGRAAFSKHLSDHTCREFELAIQESRTHYESYLVLPG